MKIWLIVKDIPVFPFVNIIWFVLWKGPGCNIPVRKKITGCQTCACVEGFARQSQLQERLSSHIADAIIGELNR
jgi:hypothetical protein